MNPGNVITLLFPISMGNVGAKLGSPGFSWWELLLAVLQGIPRGSGGSHPAWTAGQGPQSISGCKARGWGVLLPWP